MECQADFVGDQLMQVTKFVAGFLAGAAALSLSSAALADGHGAPHEGHEEAAKYVVMPANAEIVFITTGGAEVRADWSEQAKTNLGGHVVDQLTAGGSSVVRFDEEAEQSEDLAQLLLLYQLVAASADIAMPHKGGWLTNRDITLGETASMLADEYNAEQAVFVDHYSQIESGGVFLTQVMIGAATGYTPPSQNMRSTAVTIIDLKTGDLVDRNFAPLGDARDEGESAGIIRRVLRGMDVPTVEAE